jgi:5-formyltetrahydrofolate cyclo-ligase
MASDDELNPEAVVALKYQAKAMMRTRFRKLRSSIPANAIAARSTRLTERLLSLDVMRNAKHVALFYPITSRNEVDLRAVDAVLRARSGHVYYPQIDPVTRDMVFREVADIESMEERGLGFREPSSDARLADGLDVIVVPAIAVDSRGHRIGYGAGFYDRAIPRYAPPAVTIAVVFDFQLAADVPDTEGDERVSWIVTDTKSLEIER